MAEIEVVGEHGPELVTLPAGSRVKAASEVRTPKVALAYVHGDAGRITSFEDSLAAMRDWDSAHGKYLHRRFAMRFGTDGLVAARNQVAVQLLQSDCDWLLWVDTDMASPPTPSTGSSWSPTPPNGRSSAASASPPGSTPTMA
jgi:hypothetical protein